VTTFFQGATALAAAAIGLYFLRFFRATRDPFFVMFAVAFWIFAVDRVLLASLNRASDFTTVVYTVRLLAFVLIIAAIVVKNRQ
jgi:hypothetical protein